MDWHSFLQEGGMKLPMNMEGCELGYGMHDCDLDRMHNFHHDLNIDIFLTHKALGYYNNNTKLSCTAFEFTKIKTKPDTKAFAIGIPAVQIRKYLSLIIIIYSKNMEK